MSSDDDGYVHRPGAARDDGADGNAADGDGADVADRGVAHGNATATAEGTTAGSMQGADPAAADRDMGYRGWVLVAALAFSLLGAPLLILWNPPVLPYWAALLALPMLPAILLGAVAVWATTRP